MPIFCRLICRRQMMAKCTPQTFRRGHAPTSMSLPRLTSNSVGCCVPQLNGGYLRPRPHPPLSYFSSIYFDDQTDNTAHPHLFLLSRASSLTPPSLLTPILFDSCVLICKTAATFKAQAPPIPLPNQRHRTQARRPEGRESISSGRGVHGEANTHRNEQERVRGLEGRNLDGEHRRPPPVATRWVVHQTPGNPTVAAFVDSCFDEENDINKDYNEP